MVDEEIDEVFVKWILRMLRRDRLSDDFLSSFVDELAAGLNNGDFVVRALYASVWRSSSWVWVVVGIAENLSVQDLSFFQEGVREDCLH